MFHVSTYLRKGDDAQQQLKKRHIGNDCVVIVFKEDDQPFSPTLFKSQVTRMWTFNLFDRLDNFIVVQKLSEPDLDGKPQYKFKTCLFR
jgi:hypothetical protein